MIDQIIVKTSVLLNAHNINYDEFIKKFKDYYKNFRKKEETVLIDQIPVEPVKVEETEELIEAITNTNLTELEKTIEEELTK